MLHRAPLISNLGRWRASMKSGHPGAAAAPLRPFRNNLP